MDNLIKNNILEIYKKKNKTNELIPILNKDRKQLIYKEINISNIKQLHNGQRKLFFSLLNFIVISTNVNKKYNLLYIGAAPGNNIIYIAKLYKNIIFHLYDIWKNKDLENIQKENLSNVIIYNQYFTESDVLKHYDSLVFSDLRTVNKHNKVDETIILNDLLYQEKLIKLLKPIYFCLKFRIPYNINKITYLKGELYLQPFAKKLSNEVRLIGNTLESTCYYLYIHEYKMFYINLILREWSIWNTVWDKCDGCFDCALEEYYIIQYSKHINNTNIVDNIITIRSTLNQYQIKSIRHEINHTNIDLFINNLQITESHVKILAYNILKYNKLNEKYVNQIIKNNINELNKAITHSSVNNIDNYEKHEYKGDRILNLCIIRWITKNFKYNLQIYGGILITFTSGEQGTLLFAAKLNLIKLLITNNFNINKQLEDIFESILAYIDNIFDNGISICYNIISSILDEININDYIDKIFSIKMELKEFYDEMAKNDINKVDYIWNFKKNYKIIQTKNTDYIDEWSENEYSITLKIPNIKTLTYKDYGLKKNIEFKAIKYFFTELEKLKLYTKKKYHLEKINKIYTDIVEDKFDKNKFKNEITDLFYKGNIRKIYINKFLKYISDCKFNYNDLELYGDKLLNLGIAHYVYNNIDASVNIYNGISSAIITDDNIFYADLKKYLSLIEHCLNSNIFNGFGNYVVNTIIQSYINNINLNNSIYLDKIFAQKIILLETLSYYNINSDTFKKIYNIVINEEDQTVYIELNLNKYIKHQYIDDISTDLFKINLSAEYKKNEMKKIEFEACKQFNEFLKNRGFYGDLKKDHLELIKKY